MARNKDRLETCRALALRFDACRYPGTAAHFRATCIRSVSPAPTSGPAGRRRRQSRRCCNPPRARGTRQRPRRCREPVADRSGNVPIEVSAAGADESPAGQVDLRGNGVSAFEADQAVHPGCVIRSGAPAQNAAVEGKLAFHGPDKQAAADIQPRGTVFENRITAPRKPAKVSLDSSTPVARNPLGVPA
ncbi:hypothetical protein FHX03_003594 [Rhizobium sp. BK456]|nr:hypothetical protein [Rhizobium sp. BK456]